MEQKDRIPGLVIIGPDNNSSSGTNGTGSGVQPDTSSPHPRPLQPERGKEEIWQDNHEKIKRAIADYIRDNGCTPTCEELAAETKLSRRSIHNHLKRYTRSGLNQQELEQFHALTAKVFGKVIQLAEKGDLNAVNLFFQVVDKLQRKPAAKNKEEYFAIYFGNQYLMQHEIEGRLEENEKDAIEEVLKTGIAQAESDGEAAAEADPNNAEDTGNRTWENNHRSIMNSMCTLMKDKERMPNHTELATATGLSRQTITKHFKEFTYHPVYLAELEQLRSLSPQLLTQVANQADKGNIKAARLFIKLMIENFPLPDDMTQTPDHLVLNEMMITKESIKSLAAEHIDSIRAILEKFRKRGG